MKRQIFAMVCVVVASSFGCGSDGESNEQPVEPKRWTITAEVIDAAAGSAVSRCNSEGADCKPLSQGDTLSGDVVVKTGRASSALLRLDPTITVALDADASVALDQHAAPASIGRTVTLRSGRIVMRRQQASSAEPLAVRLADASASLQPNSTLAARSRAADRAVVTVHRGKLALEAAGAAVELRAGESAHIVEGKSPDKRAVWAGQVPQAGAELPSFAETDKSANVGSEAPRGVGTMTARLPGRSEVIGGVRLLSHHVRVAVRDGFARTEIEEEFHNDTDRVLEGRYVFPLPQNASISRVALWVGDQLVEGELVERKRAAGIFKGIVDDTVRPRDPALLEWVAGGHFSLKIFPIPAKKSRKVIVAYNQSLERVGHGYRYLYPMALGKQRATKIDDFSITLRASDSRSPINEARVMGHDAAVDPIKDGVVDVRYQAKSFVPSRDFAVSFGRGAGEGAELSAYVAAKGEFAPRPDKANKTDEQAQDASGYFALRVRADLPVDAALPKLTRLDRAIVIDKSFSQSPETLAHESDLVLGLLSSMDPDENFVLLACDSSCSSYPAGDLASATKASIDEAAAWLDKLVPSGASDVAGALLAAANRLDATRGGQLIYIGDGSPSAGPLHAASIAARVAEPIAARKVDLRLLSAGRTIDLLVINELAQRLGCSHQRVSRAGEPLRRRIHQLALELRQPVLRNAKLSLPDGFEQIYPSKLPNLRLGQEVVVVGKLSARRAGKVVLSGQLGSRDYQITRPIQWTEQAGRNNPLVPRLWASARVDKLQASSDKKARKQVIALSKQYRVMSRHTSFLVLENDAMFAQFGIRRTIRRADEQSDHRLGQALGKGSAAEIASALAELDVETVGAVGSNAVAMDSGLIGEAIPSAASVGTSSPTRAQRRPAPAAKRMSRSSGVNRMSGPSGGSTTVGKAKKVKGPVASVAAASVAGGASVANASSAVARLRGRFKRCYQAGLNHNPEMAGSVSLVARVGPNGEVTSVGGSASGPLSKIVPCLKAVVRSAAFSPPEGGSAVIVIPISFLRSDGSSSSSSTTTRRPPVRRRGAFTAPLRPASPLGWSPLQPRWASRYYPTPLATLLPGNDDWMGKSEKKLAKLADKLADKPNSRKRHETLIRMLILSGRFELALQAAKRFAAVDPDLDRARELLGYAAAVNGDGALALASMASLVETKPRSVRAQIRAARAFAGAGDQARACAHWISIAELRPKSALASHSVRSCAGRVGANEKAPKQNPGQLEAKLDCSGSDCPTPVVIAPNGNVYSPWTPSTARVSANSVAVQRMPSGTYRTLLVGGSAKSSVKLILRAANKTRSFQVDRSIAKTAAVSYVQWD